MYGTPMYAISIYETFMYETCIYENFWYWVAEVSRIDKMIAFFCRISSLL